jgi:hypothetical protein
MTLNALQWWRKITPYFISSIFAVLLGLLWFGGWIQALPWFIFIANGGATNGIVPP